MLKSRSNYNTLPHKYDTQKRYPTSTMNFLLLSVLAFSIAATDDTGSDDTGSVDTDLDPPVLVPLGGAQYFAILAKAGISTVPFSQIKGSIGVSPITHTAITGFNLIPVGAHAEDASVDGKIYAADYTSPTPSNLLAAVGNMETAYNNAAGRPTTSTSTRHVKFMDGKISSKTFYPGVYSWTTGISFTESITFSGDGVFILKTTNSVSVGNSASVLLANGALASNIFWQVAGGVVAGAFTHLEGTFLVKTAAVMQTHASINGRLLAQTAVTLQRSAVMCDDCGEEIAVLAYTTDQ